MLLKLSIPFLANGKFKDDLGDDNDYESDK